MASKEYFPLKLPGAKLYAEGLEVRQFGPDEVSAYDRVRRAGGELALRNLVGGTLRGVEVEDLYEPDLLFILMWHRVNSFMNYPMKLPWVCPSCSADNSDNLDVSKLVSKEVPEAYDIHGITLALPCGLPITFRLPKVGDESNARKLVTGMSIQNPNDDHFRKAEIVQLMEYDANFNDLEKWEIVNKGFSVEDIFTVDGFKQEFSYGPTTVMQCNCTKCGGQQTVGFRFSILEFLPNNYDGAAIRTRILPHKASRDAAKRAKDALIPKINMVAQATPKRDSQSPEGAAAASNGGSPSKGQGQGQKQPYQGVPLDKLPSKLMEEARIEIQDDNLSAGMDPGGMTPSRLVVKDR